MDKRRAATLQDGDRVEVNIGHAAPRWIKGRVRGSALKRMRGGKVLDVRVDVVTGDGSYISAVHHLDLR